MSYHPRCIHARYAEQARERALELDPPPNVAGLADMSNTLARLIDLSCPLECLNGTCAHEPKQAGSTGEGEPRTVQ